MAEITSAILSLIPKCPITFEPMLDPIIVDGKYCKCCVSRPAFEAWTITQEQRRQSRSSSLIVCPRCNGPLNSLNIQPNTCLVEVVSNIRSFSRIADVKEYSRQYNEDTVLFKCHIMRRANAFNTPWILNIVRKNKRPMQATRFVNEGKISLGSKKQHTTSTQPYILKEYTVAMSNLETSGDLMRQISALCGINTSDYKLFRAKECFMANPRSVVEQHTLLKAPLIDEQIPCTQLAEPNSGTSLLIAFENTLRYRRSPGDIRNEGCPSSYTCGDSNQTEQDELEKLLEVYGNAEECRLYDTETMSIAMAISRALWPKTEDELSLGLRVDAIDHRGAWYPGSVVEIIGSMEDTLGKIRAKIHFDNFLSKWDEVYTIEDFNEGRLKPLHSHTTPRSKPRGFTVHHRYTDRQSLMANLFGQSFYVDCHNEWTMARAGAQILAQASRFLRQFPLAFDVSEQRKGKTEELYSRTQATISDLIDILVDSDREFVHKVLEMSVNQTSTVSDAAIVQKSKKVVSLSSSMVKRVNRLLRRLPFEVRVCVADDQLSARGEVPYPFSLMRVVGNYMNARHAIVLAWRVPPSDKISKEEGRPNPNYLCVPVMYVPPKIHNIADNSDETSNQSSES